MQRLNIEIKARCEEHGRIRDVLRQRGAEFKGTDHQTDTYFRATSGRLKLREGNIENYLVYYDREDKAGPKQSKVILFESEPGSSLKGILSRAFGVILVVTKQREIYFVGNVKLHLDVVEGLGSFVEIEAIDADNSIGKQKLLDQCNEYVGLLDIRAGDFVSSSYSDLLLERTSGMPHARPPR